MIMTQFIASWIACNMLDLFIKQIPWIIIACIVTYILCIKFPKYVNYFIIICVIYGVIRGGYLITTLYPYMGGSLFTVLYGILLLIPYFTVFLGALLVKCIYNKRH